MFEHIKEFVKENPGIVAGGTGLALLMALNFGGDAQDIDALNSVREPASKMHVKKRDPEFRSLKNPVKKAFGFGNSKKKTKVKKKKKKKSNPVLGSSSNSGLGFGYSKKDNGLSMSYSNNDSGNNQLPEDTYSDEPSTSDDSVSDDIEVTDSEVTDSGTTTTTTGGLPGGGGGAPPVTSSCSASPGAGIYINNPSATVTCTNTSEIYYCVKKGGGCCDPTVSGEPYTSDALISSLSEGVQDDGKFCLSYFAVSASGIDSDIGYVDSYTVNDDAIDISYETSVLIRQIKSTQSHFTIPYISDSFGFEGYDFFAINTGKTAALGGATPDDCAGLADAETGYGDYNDPYIVRGPSGFYVTPTDGYDSADIIDIPLISEQPLNHSLTRGENYVTAFMRFTDAANEFKYGCISTPVLVQDPSYVRPLLSHDFSSPENVSGIVEFRGGIQAYGNFDHASTAGEGKSSPTLSKFVLESGHINITH